ncbi:hypothetical protein RB594_006501 [Gaeumannomyces avenae]
MPRRYSLEQEEFVRRRIEAGLTNPVIRDAFKARFPESHAASPFELNQVSYLRKKHKEASLGFCSPGFREQVARINEKRAAQGRPLLGESTDVDENEDDDSEEGDANKEEASNTGNGARSPRVLRSATAGNTIATTTAAASQPPAPAQTPTSQVTTQAPVQAQAQARFEPRPTSNSTAAPASSLPSPNDSSVPQQPAGQTATSRPSAQHARRPSNATEVPGVAASSIVDGEKTSATGKPDTPPAQEPKRAITGTGKPDTPPAQEPERAITGTGKPDTRPAQEPERAITGTGKPDTRPAQEPERAITGVPTRTDDMARIVPGSNAGQHKQSNLPVLANSNKSMDASEPAQQATAQLPQLALGDFHPGMRNSSLSDQQSQGTISPGQLAKGAGAVSASAPSPALQVAAHAQLAPNAHQHPGPTETSRLSQTDTDGALGKRKANSPPDLAATETSRLSQTDTDGALGKRKANSPPDLAATDENGEKRPKLSEQQPDTQSRPADAAKPEDLGRTSLASALESANKPSSAHTSNQSAANQPTHTGPVSLGGPTSRGLTTAAPQTKAGGNGEVSLGEASLGEVSLGEVSLGEVSLGESAAVQRTASPAPSSQSRFPRPMAPAQVGPLQPAAPIQPTAPVPPSRRFGAVPGPHDAHLPVPSVRDFKRTANPTIDSSVFPRIREEGAHQGDQFTEDSLMRSNSRPYQVPDNGGKTEAARKEDEIYLDMIEGQELIEAAIQAGKDAQNRIVSSKDLDHPFNRTRESSTLAPDRVVPVARAQQATMRLNRTLRSTAESPAIRVTPTADGPIMEEAPRPSEQDAEVYYVTMPLPEVDVSPCAAGAECPVPASVFHFHCHINKTVIFNSTDDFKRAATEYVRAQEDREMYDAD